jgi:exosortase A-associated hydrolase 1
VIEVQHTLATEEPIVFKSLGNQLMGILHVPLKAGSIRLDFQPKVAVVLVVGGPQYRVGSHRQFVQTARALAGAGIAAFRFDCGGMGDSDGTQRTFEDIHEDIAAAVSLVSERLPRTKLVLMGLCDAASAILMYRSNSAPLSGMVLINPWVRTPSIEVRTKVRHYYLNRVLGRVFWTKILRFEWNPLSSGRDLIQLFRSSRWHVQHHATTFVDKMLHGLERSTEPIYFILSGDDLTAREFESLVENNPRWGALVAAPRCKVRKLPRADHTFSNANSLAVLNDSLNKWLHALELT